MCQDRDLDFLKLPELKEVTKALRTLQPNNRQLRMTGAVFHVLCGSSAFPFVRLTCRTQTRNSFCYLFMPQQSRHPGSATQHGASASVVLGGDPIAAATATPTTHPFHPATLAPATRADALPLSAPHGHAASGATAVTGSLRDGRVYGREAAHRRAT